MAATTTSSNKERDYSVAILGGGICGLCVAIGLRHHNVPVQVYEATSAFGEIGAGVSLGPNASRALKLIDPAIDRGLQRCATNNAWPEHQNHWFTFRRGDIKGEKFGPKFYDQWCETGQLSVHRARFLDELVKLVPSEIAHFKKRSVSVDDKGDFVEVKFADGTTARHTAVIGCDGVKSTVRAAILGNDHAALAPTFSGKYAYRGLVPMDEAAALVGDELARNSQLYTGHGGHILTFPVEHGKTMNVVAFSTKEDGKWENPEWVLPLDKEALYRDFEGWSEAPRKILSMMRKPDIWALFDHPRAPTYFKGRICMLGDAAHASTPHNGAGAGQAIEDALIVSRLMKLVYDKRDISRAFAAFDRVRRERSQRHVECSRESGWLYDFQLPGYMDDLDKIREKLEVNKKWLWEHDLEGAIKEAERGFREEMSRL